MARSTAATCHIAAQVVPRLDSARRKQLELPPAKLRQLQAAVRLGSPVFSPISTVSTLPDLFSAPIKVSEAILEPYFTFIEL